MELLEPHYDLNILSDLKKYRMVQVDKRTEELIYAGFTFDGQLFSMSTSAQINLSNIFNIPDELFPLPYSTKDDGVYSLALANRQNFYLSALNHKNTSIQSGTALKVQINAATTIEEINNLVDNR